MHERHRRHVNPFSLRFTAPIEIPDWPKVFGREAPYHLDIGTGKGAFALALAEAHPEYNVVALEIRDFLVEGLKAAAAAQGLTNLAALMCNVNVHLSGLFPDNSLDTVYINFPDPWYKARHHKRRVLNEVTAKIIAEKLIDGGHLLVATDNEPLAQAMLEALEQEPLLINLQEGGGFSQDKTPFGPGPTEREAWHESQGDPIYRMRFKRIAR